MSGSTAAWHLLQLSDVLDMEFALGLSQFARVIAWEPQRSWNPWLTQPGQEVERVGDRDNLRIRKLPLLRGYARPLVSNIVRTAPQVVERLRKQSLAPERTPLVCTIPYFAEVAEQWPGPVVYWLTDLMAEYTGADRDQVRSLDERMCAAATLCCPNSERLGEYLVRHGGCDPEKVCIIPNATRASSLLANPSKSAEELPRDAQHLPRPVAGVIGNLAGNMDWVLLEQMIIQTPWLHWLFVGPTSMTIPSVAQAKARSAVMKHQQVCFVGKQPYAELARYARSFDVAVLPYRRCEPTYSGSSTRFYEHLAACRPMIATRGFAELLQKQPLLQLVDTALEGVSALETLRDQGFDDGFQALRWNESHAGTWDVRAWTMQVALAARVPWLSDTLDYFPDKIVGAAR